MREDDNLVFIAIIALSFANYLACAFVGDVITQINAVLLLFNVALLLMLINLKILKKIFKKYFNFYVLLYGIVLTGCFTLTVYELVLIRRSGIDWESILQNVQLQVQVSVFITICSQAMLMNFICGILCKIQKEKSQKSTVVQAAAI